MISLAAGLPAFNRASFDYFDGVVVVWLIVGLFRGRSRGMSQEILPTLQWIAIVALAGLFYSPLSAVIHDNTNRAFDVLWSNITAYILIAIAVHLVFLGLKRAVGEKLVGSDFFGRSEYYMGSVAGVIRFGCMLVVLCALMHSRVITKAERESTEKAQKQSFEDIRFPTYGSIQQAVLFDSFSGNLVETHLNNVMIASVTPLDIPKRQTLASQREAAIDAILAPPRK
jgi:uncharacterized membrane protein required for colicin V production